MSWPLLHLSWMGGLYEGEGCISAPKTNSPLRIRIKSTDHDVLLKFMNYAKCGGVSGPYRASGLGIKPVYEYATSGRNAYALAVALWSFLGSRRQHQITEALCAYAKISRIRKLSCADVEIIKAVLASSERGAARSLARRFGVSEAMVSRIKHGRAWQ